MNAFALWLCLLIPGLWAGWMGLVPWGRVMVAAVSSGIFAALVALFGEEA